MNKRSFILITILFLVLLFTFLSSRLLEESKFNNKKTEEVRIFTPYEGSIFLEHDVFTSDFERTAPNALNFASKDSIASFRINKVKRYSQLKIFPENYHPFKSYHKNIYNSITPKKTWVSSVVYYIANPYLLVVVSNAGYVNPLNLLYPYCDLFYKNGVIKETHSGAEARKWFDYVFDKKNDHPGKVWLVMVNGVDAGLFYAFVDVNRSKNVKKSPKPSNITRRVHRPVYHYHVGKYKKNNLSPNDPNAWVTLKEKNVDTKIHVKLWYDKPDSASENPDITYIFNIKMESEPY